MSEIIHLPGPELGLSHCGESVTPITDYDTHPVCQTCHVGAIQRLRAKLVAADSVVFRLSGMREELRDVAGDLDDLADRLEAVEDAERGAES